MTCNVSGDRRKERQWVLLLCAAIFLFLSGTARAGEWWNSDWQFRRQIDLVTSPQGADIQEPLNNIPVLVRLHAGNFNFANAKPDGSDLRFVAGDNKTQLKHQIDVFDPTDEVGLVWVNVPAIAAAGQSKIYLYYGNQKVAAAGQDPAGTFANKFGLVLHMGEAQGPPKDSSGHNNNAGHFAGGQAQPSVIGNGMSLYGGTDKIVIPGSPTLNMADGFTFSGWLRLSQPQEDGYLFFRGDASNSVIIGVAGTSLYAQVSAGGKTARTPATPGLTPATWHHIAVAGAPGGKLTVYVDGREMAGAALPGLLPNLSGDIILGASAADTHHFAGDLDEIRLSNTSRSAGWIKGLFSSQGLESKLVSYGAEESGGGGGGGMLMTYMQIIVSHIEWDGWAILACMMIMIILCWCVIISKTVFFSKNHAENVAFREMLARKEGTDQYINDSSNGEFKQSSLYQVYRLGCEELHKLMDSAEKRGKTGLTTKDMHAFRATLERGFVHETKGYSAWLPILTMSITGGPFMGLFGTVWGVMMTFAGMAAAGEASIMAIAPGIASALICTVFGLLVAIPALFGYNFLVNRLKNLTVDLTVFTEEFAVQIDRQYGEY